MNCKEFLGVYWRAMEKVKFKIYIKKTTFCLCLFALTSFDKKKRNAFIKRTEDEE